MQFKSLFLPQLMSILLLAQFSSLAHAVKWTKLTADKHRTMYVDKASISEQENMRKAWLKIAYKTQQTNSTDSEKHYNLSKVLWYFKCSEQQSATSQVAQYLDDTLTYSAGIAAKKAVFIDPVPETDVDVAMRFVCKYDRKAEEAQLAKIAAEKAAKKKAEEEKKKAEEEKRKAAEAQKKADEIALQKAREEKARKEAEAELSGDHDSDKKSKKHTTSHTNSYFKHQKDKKNATWRYRGRRGPKYWGKISDEYALCDSGRNQSPVDIKNTIDAKLGEIKSVRKFPATSIENTGKGIEVLFEEGNMMVIDDIPYHLTTLQFHQPSEHTINGKQFELEAQFIHQHKSGSMAVLALLFKKGAENQPLNKLWESIPHKKRTPIPLEKEITPKELIPHDDDYYRVNGSLTTPPCTEGVRWVIKKNIQTVSDVQLAHLKKTLRKYNVRPVQKLYGRMVLE